MNQDLLLQRAERLCDQRGIRFTPTRRQVFRLLAAHGNAISAYDLLAQLQQTEAHAKPPTVYRALEFLERKGMAHRIASISAYVACTGPGDHAHAAAFLICDCCGATEEVAAPLGDAFTQAAGSAGYVLERTTIEGHGRCPTCRPAAAF